MAFVLGAVFKTTSVPKKMSDDHIDPEPTNIELHLLGAAGRMARLIKAGLTPIEAAVKIAAPETAEEYLKRNHEAMEELEKRLMSPKYQQRFAEIEGEPDPVKKAKMRADLKRENFTLNDMEAVHRQISARNRQMKAEGMLPPNAPI